MSILADISAVQDRKAPERGVPRYTAEFAETAARLRPGLVDEWLLREGEPIPPFLLGLLSAGRVSWARDAERAPDILHNLAPFHRVGNGLNRNDLLDTRLVGPGTRVVATVYDMIPLIYAGIYFRDPVFRDDYLLACSYLQHADRVLTISDSAARDAVRLLGLNPAKVESVGTGVPGSFTPSHNRESVLLHLAHRFPRIRAGFLLYVGGIDFRKNMDGLLRAYALLDADTRRAHPLVVVCRLVGDSARYLRRTTRRLGIDVILTDLVDDATLQLLYQATDLFIFPSLYEGFGLPVVEALRSGAPVAVGDNSSLRDIVPIPEARFDASDPESIAACIRATLSSEAARTLTLREIDTGMHTWETVVENTADAYRRVIRSTRQPTGHKARRRLAFVSPLPPAATGIAIYNERLLHELARLIDVDVFAQPEADQLDIPGVRQFEYGAYGSLHGGYLDTIIALGNSFHHMNEYEILQKFGGTVMQHDVRVSGLMANVLGTRPDMVDGRSALEIEEFKRREFPRRLGPYQAYDFDDQTQVNSLMSRFVTRAADRVLVHSAAGMTVARLEADPADRDRIERIPLAFETPAEIDRHGADAITSFGYLSRTKHTPLLCEAFSLASHRLPGITFAFVGYLGDTGLRHEMDEIITENHAEGRVIVTGWQSAAEYSAWLARSILTIQPRTTFNGEASAAVTESIGFGVPTIVSDIGWMGELPDDVVGKIPLSISAEHLADLIVDLVDDPGALERMSRNGVEYAARHDFSVVAAQLHAIISRPA